MGDEAGRHSELLKQEWKTPVREQQEATADPHQGGPDSRDRSRSRRRTLVSASLPTPVPIPRALRAASITGIRVAGMKESQEETRIRDELGRSLLGHTYCFISSWSWGRDRCRRTVSFLSPRSPPRRSNMGSRTVSSSPHPTVTTPAVHLSKEHLLENLLAMLSSGRFHTCLLYTSPSPRDKRQSRMPSSA